MTARILSGKPIADAIKNEIAEEVSSIETAHGFRPCLAAVRVGADPASEIYVGNKVKTAAQLNIISEHHHLPGETSHEELMSLVKQLNARDDVDGILVQLPLPKHIDERSILEAIDPMKDVDGFHPVNVGKLSLGYPSLVPCTPAGVVEILKRSGIEIAGRHAVIVGRSNIVGKPLAMLMLRENATVTICHSKTPNLAEVCRDADILVAAVGRPGLVTRDFVKPGAAVVDVGINRVTDPAIASRLYPAGHKRLALFQSKGSILVGDVHPEVEEVAGALTPVPGGVGPLTITMLMANTLKAARERLVVSG